MEFWDQQIVPRLSNVETIEWFTFGVNILVFLFSNTIASRYGAIQEEARMKSRLRILHGFNLVVFITFILSVAIDSQQFPAEQISQTCLTLLCAYLVMHLAEALLVRGAKVDAAYWPSSAGVSSTAAGLASPPPSENT